jgi:YVTN family beta-propeller protein
MRRRTALELLCTGTLTTLVGTGCSSNAPRAFVTNEDSNNITVINTDSLEVVATVPVGKRPRGARVSLDGAWLYVALSGSPKSPPGADERGLPEADRSADGIGAVDLAKLVFARMLPAGRDPETFDLTPDGTRLVVSNQETAEASVIDLQRGAFLWSAIVGLEPEGVAVRPDGALAYVTSELEDLVSILDLRLGERIGTIATGKRPRGVVFDRQGTRAYVTDELGATVTVIDAREHVVLGTIPIGDPSARPMGLRVTPDGRQLVVSNGRGGTVSIVSLSEARVTRTVAGVTARPWGLDVTPDGRRALVACGPSNDVAVIDLASGAVIRRVPAGRSPWGVAIEPAARTT